MLNDWSRKVKTIKRIEGFVAVLEYLASIDYPCGVSDISRELSLNKISVFRILASLEEAGWVAQEPVSQKYKLGHNLLMFGLQLISHIELQKVALPNLYELTQITGENSALSIRLGLERVFVQEIPGRHEARQTAPVGQHMPLWFGAAGKSILASMSENDIEKVIKQFDDPQTAMTILGHEVDTRELKREFIVIKRQGYAISVGERHPDVCAIASPIFNRNQMVVGSVSLRGLLPRFNFKLAKKNAFVVRKTANKISQDLGGTAAFSNPATKYIRPGKRQGSLLGY